MNSNILKKSDEIHSLLGIFIIINFIIESLKNQQQSSDTTLKQHLENFKEERNTLQGKIEKLSNELSTKEIELVSTKNKLKDVQVTIDKLTSDGDSSKIQNHIICFYRTRNTK